MTNLGQQGLDCPIICAIVLMLESGFDIPARCLVSKCAKGFVADSVLELEDLNLTDYKVVSSET